MAEHRLVDELTLSGDEQQCARQEPGLDIALGEKAADEGEALADLSNVQDPERLQLDENTVYLLIDATSPTLPSARKVRVIYHPPLAKPVLGNIAGMLSGGSGGGVRIFRGGTTNKGWDKTKEAGTPFKSSEGK